MSHTAAVRAARASVAVLLCAAMCSALPSLARAAAGFGEIKGPGACLLESGTTGDSQCAQGNGLLHPAAVALSPDGTSVYVVGGTSGSQIDSSFGSVAILKRDPGTGEVSDVGCLSSDGTDGRDGASGICATSSSLLGADGVSVSADGRTVFITSQRSASVVAFARDPATGALTRIGCVAAPRFGTPCTPANIFQGSSDIVTSPDDSSLFLASPSEGTLSALIAPRPTAGTPAPSEGGAPSSAALASLFAPASAPGAYLANPCVAVNGYDGACAVGVAMRKVGSLSVSPDGKELYAAAPDSHAIDTFALSGAEPLVQSGCLKAAAPPGLCSSSALLSAPGQLAISPDGRNVYAADSAEHGARIDVLSRNAATGALTDSSCVDFLPEPPKAEPGGGEGEDESEEAKEREQEAAKERERLAADPCQSVPGLESLDMLAVSGDGSSVWALASGSAVSFSRDQSTGKLTETACASSSDSRCAKLADFEFAAGALSPDGRNVYVATGGEQAFLAFGIGASVTAASASANRNGLARVAVACPASLRRPCYGRLVLTRVRRIGSRHGVRAHSLRMPAGASRPFTIAAGRRGEIAVQLDGRTRALLLRGRRVRVTVAVRAAARAGGSGLGRRVMLVLARR